VNALIDHVRRHGSAGRKEQHARRCYCSFHNASAAIPEVA
jgi:hypothetical protein